MIKHVPQVKRSAQQTAQFQNQELIICMMMRRQIKSPEFPSNIPISSPSLWLPTLFELIDILALVAFWARLRERHLCKPVVGAMAPAAVRLIKQRARRLLINCLSEPLQSFLRLQSFHHSPPRVNKCRFHSVSWLVLCSIKSYTQWFHNHLQGLTA